MISGCATKSADKPLPVTIPRDCEHIAQPVPHAPAKVGMDARAVWKRERAQLDQANARLTATRHCQEQQRESFARN
jgi:hypothetical protein